MATLYGLLAFLDLTRGEVAVRLGPESKITTTMSIKKINIFQFLCKDEYFIFIATDKSPHSKLTHMYSLDNILFNNGLGISGTTGPGDDNKGDVLFGGRSIRLPW